MKRNTKIGTTIRQVRVSLQKSVEFTFRLTSDAFDILSSVTALPFRCREIKHIALYTTFTKN